MCHVDWESRITNGKKGSLMRSSVVQRIVLQQQIQDLVAILQHVQQEEDEAIFYPMCF